MNEIISKLERLRSIAGDLAKWERSGSMTMVNREAHYQALTAVKDHVLSYIAAMVSGMQDDQIREVVIAGYDILVRKIMQDMYSGKVTKDGQIVHEFTRITVPQLAGQLQSLLELYDPEKLEDGDTSAPQQLLIAKLTPLAEKAPDGMVSQLISILAGQMPPKVEATPENDINDIIREANEITEEAKRNAGSPDPREQIERLKQRVKEMLHRVESLVAQLAPTSQSDDLLQDTLHQMQRKHDYLVDRVQQELNILEDRIAEVDKKVGDRSRTITIKVD